MFYKLKDTQQRAEKDYIIIIMHWKKTISAQTESI